MYVNLPTIIIIPGADSLTLLVAVTDNVVITDKSVIKCTRTLVVLTVK